MKKVAHLFQLLCWMTLFFPAMAQPKMTPISIIPEPVKITPENGFFLLKKHFRIQAPDLPDLQYTVQMLRDRLTIPTGYSTQVRVGKNGTSIRLELNAKADPEIGQEGYHLSVTKKLILITANQPAGLFYGVQTLLQLFPPQIESKALTPDIKWQAPCVEITDYPRFAWRGLMLDVARHFFTPQQVEAYINQMAKYKFNVFHWHLTDDEGWRIQINSLPNLTRIGAWNVKKTGYFGTFSAPLPDEPRNYGGFYTHQQIREVIRYAQARFVNILPEVDVPGHSLAAIASYPDLSCTPGADHYQVNSGEKFMAWKGGGPTALEDNTLCPANPKVYVFLDTVFSEIARLFPFPYIHVGGDECAKNFWAKSPEVKALMARHDLKTLDEVQSYFEKKVEKIIASKGKIMIGWDEILQGGLAPGAVVMSWRGEQGGIDATKMGHQVVMSPTTYAYLDYMQGDPVIEPHVYATLTLRKAYRFDPVPEGADPKMILGGQANLWTEQVYNMRHAEYMTWPRAFAISESVWSPQDRKNWEDFVGRVEQQFKRLDVEQVKYAPSLYDPQFKAIKNAQGQLVIEMSTEIKGLDIHYSFDNSFPDQFYPTYTQPLIPPKDAVMLKVITYRGQKPMGRMISMPIAEMDKRAGIQP